MFKKSGKYKVFSPNCAEVEERTFSSQKKAFDYYDSLVFGTRGKSLPAGAQLQLLNTKTGKILDCGAFYDHDIDMNEVLKEIRQEPGKERAVFEERTITLADGSKHNVFVEEDNPVTYKVFSPNSDMVETKEFDSAVDAAKYYCQCRADLMKDPRGADVKIQCEDSNELLMRRVTILNDMANRCAIEVALNPDCDVRKPRYDVLKLELKDEEKGGPEE